MVIVHNQRGIVSSRGVVEIHNSIIAGNTLAGIANATLSIGAPLAVTGNYSGALYDAVILPGASTGFVGGAV